MNPFLQGKANLSSPSLRLPPGLAAATVPPGRRQPQRPATGAAAPAGASVEVVKEGDKVVRLVVTCACGERVEVECLYPVGI